MNWTPLGGDYRRQKLYNRGILVKNPRICLAISHLDCMDNGLLRNHLAVAEEWRMRMVPSAHCSDTSPERTRKGRRSR
ncbi:hypothetical protein MCON_1533 [Methanothrix soehngenii GP6]|uniref:Uncharacterized protein n=1 Tax=Methanothrix soehngenii (strain ATCC 5969 / DSM 3671 / JCM 10134 / NBRC 103675 / OCM 69 / GP-6) TaxID=990316 RepID=F4BTH6_METSG|nr:hypothetical protein MCON_1533 [Methanothrix soehngenii GP6]